MSGKILCEVRVKGGGTKRIETTWSWYTNYGWPYVNAILMY